MAWIFLLSSSMFFLTSKNESVFPETLFKSSFTSSARWVNVLISVSILSILPPISRIVDSLMSSDDSIFVKTVSNCCFIFSITPSKASVLEAFNDMMSMEFFISVSSFFVSSIVFTVFMIFSNSSFKFETTLELSPIFSVLS